jgi:hypothetical protein
MAATAAPYGLKPVELLNGRAYPGAFGTYRIESGETDTFFYGQPVQLVSGYIVEISAAGMGGSGTPNEYIGVFMGCSYTDPNTGQPVWRQNYPGSVTASDIKAFIADDPDIVFQIQTEYASFDCLAAVGTCFDLNETDSGSTVTGVSNIALDTSGGAAATKPFKIVGMATLPDNINASGYVDCLVTVNRLFHLLAGNNG